MRITGGSTGIAIIAVGGYLVWRARGGATRQPAMAATHLAVFPQGAAGPTQGQLQTQGPYPGGPGPGSASPPIPGFAAVPGTLCSNCGTDTGRLIRRSEVASPASAWNWGVAPVDTTGVGRGVPYP